MYLLFEHGLQLHGIVIRILEVRLNDGHVFHFHIGGNDKSDIVKNS